MSDGVGTNWAGNVAYGAAEIYFPGSVEQVQERVARSSKIRALGSRHSFNRVADTDGALLSLEKMPRVFELNRDAQTVTVDGGVRYGELAKKLHAQGIALHNLASLPHISVAGAVSTATHGSGDSNGCLASTVVGLELLTASGEILRLSQGDADFPGAVVSLGALGIVTTVTLAVEPTYEIAQTVYENLPFETAVENLEAVFADAYSVSLFTDWRGPRFTQVWRKSKLDDAPESFFGARRADGPRHPISGVSAENCTEQMDASGPWHQRLPHFRLEFTPSAGAELQTEYLVPKEFGADAIRAVYALREKVAPILLVSEIRSVAADGLWLSPFYGNPGVGIHFTWKPNWDAVKFLLPEIEAALAPFHAMPHWGKLSTVPPERLRTLYPRLPEFRTLARTLDPTGKFRNAFIENLL